MHFKELETKYFADDIGMDDFIKLIQPLNPEWMMVSSYDDYFTNDSGEFIRYRYHDHMGELTIKRKTTDANNNNRVEVNIPTDGKSGASIEAFTGLLGYKKNFSIFKTCKIAFLEEEAWAEVVKYDNMLAPLGISAKNRLKKSLFEIFKK
jgi:adenylate cyclase class IV